MTPEEIDCALDDINEFRQLQKESNELGNLNPQINYYLDCHIKEIFEEMKYTPYKIVKKHIYELIEILNL